MKLVFMSKADRDMTIDYLVNQFEYCCDFCELINCACSDNVPELNCADHIRSELVKRSIVVFPFL